jgi:catechol 2,3-dioxygenase-like lactoylglutathione lyase family enzyme
VLETPRFHHLHLNSIDPVAATDFYVAQFSATSRTTWAGIPALTSPNDVLVLFTSVPEPPAIEPDTAIWHFGWHVTDVRGCMASFGARDGVDLLPLYTGYADGAVYISSDTWPGAGGLLGRTRAQIEEARATGLQPPRGGGFAYLQGPDRAIVEYAGNYPAQRFNHVHMWQEDPLCAERWYVDHLQAEVLSRRGEEGLPSTVLEDCKVPRGAERSFPALEPAGTYRIPSGGVAFGDVWLPWYMRQGDEPLESTRGHVYDHFALGVRSFDDWVAKLQAEGVRFLLEPYALGDTRAVMIGGPSLEAIELVDLG